MQNDQTYFPVFYYRGVAFYHMEDLDMLTQRMTLSKIIGQLSPQFDPQHKFFWVQPKTGRIESSGSLRELALCIEAQ